MIRTTVFGAYDGDTFGVLERVADHLAVPDCASTSATSLAASSPAGRCSPPVRWSGRSCSAATIGRVSCSPRPCGPM